MTIWKYTLGNTGVVQNLSMPEGAKILRAQMQHDAICIWALVNEDAPHETRGFVIYGTGHTMRAEVTHKFIDTIQMLNGSLIFHVFELQQQGE